MVITVNIYYQSINGNAKKFAEEMISSGIVNEIRSENGNIRYDYFFPMDDNETVLLIDSWNDQHALDIHHASSMMKSFRYGVLPVKRTMKNNKFFSVSLLTGWRYFYAAFNVSS